MIQAKGYAAHSETAELVPFPFERREVGTQDVLIEILYCGICHSDIHTARNEWGGTRYPVVPGHEIVGRIVRVGEQVTRFRPGDLAGVGCFVDSCRTCPSCRDGLEQYCEKQTVSTYNALIPGATTPTYGGYSNTIVVDEKYTLKIPASLPLERVAPLLCAGITTYSPLRTWNVGKGDHIAILGLGGLGHMAVKFAVSFGAEVTMLSSSPSKEADAKQLGAHHFALTSDATTMSSLRSTFDYIVNTVSAPHNLNTFLPLLKRDGTMILLGAPPKPHEIPAFGLIGKRRRVTGSMIGGIRETQEMLDYCAEHHILCDVELISAHQINAAYERVLRSDVKYRFVIDMSTL
jgi:uncharacterized zinc-type alcohol dehydrogenase-like protein